MGNTNFLKISNNQQPQITTINPNGLFLLSFQKNSMVDNSEITTIWWLYTR